jgi:dihydrodipicolinate synthase/N-acetylneuraminate lyase
MERGEPFRGVFVIVVTPFDEDGRLDEESLRAVVDFCIEAGVHGLVTPANASEWYALSDAERHRVSRIVVEQAGKRLPVVLSVTAGSQWPAVEMAQAAQDIGADALMAMPPPLKPPHRDGMFEYYQALSEVARVPIIVQNCHPPLGTPMPPDLLARMVDELPRVDYVKEEAEPCTHLMSRVAELVKNRTKFKGIFGGQAGRFFMNEAARGACGTMPACDIPDAHCALWAAFERGDLAETRRLYYRILPLLTMESLYPMILYKEVLRRRGAIRTAVVRNPSQAPLDEVDHRELDILLEELSDLLPVKGPFA